MPGVVCFYYSAPEYLTFLFVWLTLHRLSYGSLGRSSRTSGDAIWAIILMSYVLFFSHQVKPWDSGWSVRVGVHDLSRANHNIPCDWCVEVEREKVLFCREGVILGLLAESCHHMMMACLQNKAKQKMKAEGSGRVTMMSCGTQRSTLLPSKVQNIWGWIYT